MSRTLAEDGVSGSFTATPFYQVTSQIILTGNNTNTNRTVGVDVNTDITASAVPAPPALLMLFTGLPVAGVGLWFRRRRGN